MYMRHAQNNFNFLYNVGQSRALALKGLGHISFRFLLPYQNLESIRPFTSLVPFQSRQFRRPNRATLINDRPRWNRVFPFRRPGR